MRSENSMEMPRVKPIFKWSNRSKRLISNSTIEMLFIYIESGDSCGSQPLSENHLFQIKQFPYVMPTANQPDYDTGHNELESHWQSQQIHWQTTRNETTHTQIEKSHKLSFMTGNYFHNRCVFFFVILYSHIHSDFDSNFSFAMATHTVCFIVYIRHENSISGTNVKYLNNYNMESYMPIHSVSVRGIGLYCCFIVIVWIWSKAPAFFEISNRSNLKFQNNWQTVSIRIRVFFGLERCDGLIRKYETNQTPFECVLWTFLYSKRNTSRSFFCVALSLQP